MPGSSPAVAPNVMVATSSSLGTAAALETFARGGGAMDAAVAADAALGVVQPMRTGLGGDLFAVVEQDGELFGYNGSGGLPAGFAPPDGPLSAFGGDSVTVPGLVEAWATLHARFGRLDLGACLEPAIRLARDGYPLGAREADEWEAEARRLDHDVHPLLLPGGRVPVAGQRLANPAQARTLEAIGRRGARALYEGPLAEAIVAEARRHGSALALDDLAAHGGEWVTPLPPAPYRDWEIVELPPNCQGAVVTGALAVLGGGAAEQARVAAGAASADGLHRQIEAVKAAFTEASACIGDPRAGGSSGRLGDPAWAASVAGSIGVEATNPPPEAVPLPGGTSYVAAADRQATVSLISSDYAFFGTGAVVEEGGFVLHNRGAGFRALASPGHPNRPAPGRRPFHTIIPALVRRGGGGRWGALGVTGGQFQPQGHVQVLELLTRGLDVQAAVDAPRWHWVGSTWVVLEAGLREHAEALTARGHTVVDTDLVRFGAAQIVLPSDGYWHGGSDGRQDSLAAGM